MNCAGNTHMGQEVHGGEIGGGYEISIGQLVGEE